jgi:predicted enzyme related to lactoylglutathione lyase
VVIEAHPGHVVVPGSPCWLELATSDTERSMRFYRDLFDWDYRLLRDESGQDYALALLGGAPVAGIRPQGNLVRGSSSSPGPAAGCSTTATSRC